MTIFSAVSIASLPELAKNTWLNGSGSIAATRSASAKLPGWPSWNGAV